MTPTVLSLSLFSHFSPFTVVTAAAATAIPTIVVFIFPVLLCSILLCAVLCCAVLCCAALGAVVSFIFLSSPFMHVHLLPYLIPIRRNSVVLLEVRALAVNYLRSPLARAIPLLFLASFVRPYPRCSCTCPLISRLYFRGSLYSHTFFCTLQPRNLFKNPVSLERGSSLPLSPCYMPCIRPWLLERGSQLIIHA